MRYLLLLITSLTVTLPFSAQNEVWNHQARAPSSILGLTLLENGHILQGIQARESIEFTEIDPTNGRVNETRNVIVESRLIHFERYLGDTLIMVFENGILATLAPTSTVPTPVTQLFPRMAENDDDFLLRRVEWIHGTLIAYALKYTTNSDLVLESQFNFSERRLVSPETRIGNGNATRWYSDEGNRATINHSPDDPFFSLTVDDSNGEELMSVDLPSSADRVTKVLFTQPDRLYVLVNEIMDEVRVSILFEVDVANNSYQRITFPTAEPYLGISFENMRLLDEDLVLLGYLGQGITFSTVSAPLVLALDQVNQEKWRFSTDLGFSYNTFSDAIKNADEPGGLFLCGNTRFTDVASRGNAFTMKVGLTVSSVYNEPARPLKTFPNPATTHLNINGLPPGLRNVEVIDLAGRVLSRTISGRAINVQKLPAGTYFVRAEMAGERFLGKFVKR